MLVVTRNPERGKDSIIIEIPPSSTSTLVEVVLTEIQSMRKARIGVNASAEVQLCRAELYGTEAGAPRR